MKAFTCSLLCGLVLLAAAAATSGQTFHGGLRGEVSDVGGPIPGVTVTLVNEETNISRETVTNEVGQYAFSAVNPGTYTIKATISGFKPYENRAVRIGTQEFITLDILLEVGAIEETVTVSGEAPVIETSNASIGSVLDRKVLESLPSPGRNAYLIGVTVPSVVPTGDAQFNRQQDQTNASLLSLGGGPRRANNYLLDGFPITDMRNRSVVNPTIEALEEVKVQVHTYDAEMGRTGGGVFNVTGKSGTNQFRGTGFYQTRPTTLLEQNFFLKRDGIPKADQYYRLYGGGIGGPLVKDRTFFWTALEGYRSLTTRNISVIFPTERERGGDFSQTFDRNGKLVVVYDPLKTTRNPATGQIVRVPFPNNVIPPDRLNPVAARILSFVPQPDVDSSNGEANYVRQPEIVDRADMVTAKVEHKFTNKVSLSGMYVWNRTDEPFTVFWDDNLFGNPAWKLDRTINAVVVNNTYIPNETTVVTLRGGWNRFEDNCSVPHDFDPGELGFNPAFANSIQFKKFPRINATDFGWIGTDELAGWDPRNDIQWSSWGVNGSVAKLVGRHTLKAGADFRQMGLDTQIWGQSSGDFTFDRGSTQGPDPLSPAPSTGSAIADLLLGFPASGDAVVSDPTEVFFRYYGLYAQDDFRISSKFTLNYGLRLEREEGLQEKEDRLVVAFDQNATSPLNDRVRLPDDIVSLRGDGQIRGGLLYAGQNGAPKHQGDPPAIKLSPRVGVVYALSPRTVVRGGYGIFWAPWNYPFPSEVNYGQTGYSQVTTLAQDFPRPSTTLNNPFPNGLLPPSGNSLGLLTGVGGNVSFIDQARTQPRTQQWSVDVQRELPGDMAVSVGYMGARGDHLSFGGTIDSFVNINQIDPRFLSLGNALFDSVANPFFGVSEAGSLASRATVARWELLRPFPQFAEVRALQVSEGKSRYHALVVQLDKRVRGWWGGRFNWTFSRLKDNQFGESNFFAQRPARPQNNYDLEAEFSHGLLDMPHKIVLAPIVELPFGVGRQYMNTGGVKDYLLGGWSISAILTLESGFPNAVDQTPSILGPLGFRQRPNVAGADPATPGRTIDRLGNYLNPDAWSLASPFELGNAPRTDTRTRTPFRKNLDLVFTKDFRTGGRTRAQLRIELINATNTPKFQGFPTTVGSGTFGQIVDQSGFMRITQISFRFLF